MVCTSRDGRMSRGLPAFAALFSDEQKRRICEAPMFSGHRHPVWVPLFGERTALHAGHYRLEQSVKLIADTGGVSWLKTKAKKLLDQKDVTNASAAMAEIRAFGGLIEAGFDVEPLPEADETTPDFIAKTQHQAVAVEVAAKLQDRKQDELQGRIHDAIHGKGPVPRGVGHSVHRSRGGSIQMLESVHQPGGSPDPSKPHDSVQANLISRVCGIKGKEHQIPEDMAAILVVDFNDFGVPLTPRTLIDQTAPAIAGREGVTSGALWYAFFGWKGAPVFGGDERVKMGHDGRFRMCGDSKSRLSAALLVMPEHVVCFEHPMATFPLAEDTRLRIVRFPRFDLKHSVLEWTPGSAEQRVALPSLPI